MEERIKKEFNFLSATRKLVNKNVNREITTKELKTFLRENYGYSEIYVALFLYPKLKLEGFYIKGGGAKWVIGLKDEKK